MFVVVAIVCCFLMIWYGISTVLLVCLTVSRVLLGLTLYLMWMFLCFVCANLFDTSMAVFNLFVYVVLVI